MKQIGRVYEIPESDTLSEVTLRKRISGLLRRQGYQVRTDPYVFGVIYNNDSSELLGLIQNHQVVTINGRNRSNRSLFERLGLKTPQLDKLLEDLTLEQLEEQR